MFLNIYSEQYTRRIKSKKRLKRGKKNEMSHKLHFGLIIFEILLLLKKCPAIFYQGFFKFLLIRPWFLGYSVNYTRGSFEYFVR